MAIGLSELLINAVEHGNLGIKYTDKSQLLKEQQWQQEVERRLKLPENANRYVMVEFERGENDINLIIKDQGEGFEWQQYLEFSSERITDSHGRGIAMANMCGFDNFEYRGTGNEIMITIEIKENWTEI